MKKFVTVLFLLFVCNIGFSQEVEKNRIFSMTDFSGGIATKLGDYSLSSKYAEIAENIRLNTSLTDISKRPVLYLFGTADTTEPITGSHRLYLSDNSKIFMVTHGDELETASDTTGVFTAILDLTTADYRWDFVTWHDLAIAGDGYNYDVKTNTTDATYLGTCFAEDNGAGAGPDGSYKYKVSFYTASYEVIFDVPSNQVTVTDNDIDLSMIPIGPDTFLGEDIVGRKVYRNTVAAPAAWKLLTNGTIANNTATTLTDSDADGALGAAYPAGDATWTPPKCKLWLVHNNRLFGANNPTYPSRIYYSKDGSHDLFENTDYFDIRKNDGGEITCIENLLGILTIGKTTSWQKLYTEGDDPASDWEISDPFSMIGCDAMYSAVNTPLGIMYLSRAKEGIYVFNGQHSILKSEKFTPIIQDISISNLSNCAGEYNNNIYYITYTSLETGVGTNNRVLNYDMLLDAATVDILNINEFCSFDSGLDGGTLFAGASNNGKVYQYSNVSKSVIHRRHTDFSGTFDDARYLPTIAAVGGDSESPVLELSWDVTIDTYGAGTVNAASGDVDRPDGTGSYISPVIATSNASTYDKIYWNEILPSGCDATFAIRSGATSGACEAAGWSATEYSNAAGSDISGETANEYTQYRITLSSSDIDYTPNVTTLGGFTVKLVYNTAGSVADNTIALHYRTGWLDFKRPTYEKALREIFVFLEGASGTLTIKVTNEYGDSDTFDIDVNTYPVFYLAYFTNGILQGRKFQFDITNSDLNALKIREIHVMYDTEPII